MHSSVVIGIGINQSFRPRLTSLENLNRQMFEVVVKKIVDNQIKDGRLEESERTLYLYGYQMIIESAINFIVSILIALIFQAFEIVITFTIAFLLIRGYVGGKHAKTSFRCFCYSAGILIASVITVKFINSLQTSNLFFLLEVIMLPYIFWGTPMPDVNKPITENESVHFNKKVKQIYTAQLIIELILLFCGLDILALSIWVVHVVLFIMVLQEFLFNWIRNKYLLDN